jgi:hypothetical protein
MQVISETARVLITVKASPEPSAKYGDTVCVAGIRVDGGRAEWVRLYPLAFRWMGVEQQFKKVDLIDVEMRRESKDSRPESYRPDIDSIEIVKHLDDWKDRQPFMERVARTSTCALSAAAAEHHKAVLDALHLRKIDLADRVLVVNPGGYIGESTGREIAYARAAGKPVSFAARD